MEVWKPSSKDLRSYVSQMQNAFSTHLFPFSVWQERKPNQNILNFNLPKLLK